MTPAETNEYLRLAGTVIFCGVVIWRTSAIYSRFQRGLETIEKHAKRLERLEKRLPLADSVPSIGRSIRHIVHNVARIEGVVGINPTLVDEHPYRTVVDRTEGEKFVSDFPAEVTEEEEETKE